MQYDHPSFEELSQKEWLVTNGLGGYASSSLSGANTRRYHGLLVAAMNPPTGRTVFVSKVEETLKAGEYAVELTANQYPGVVHPRGFEHLKSFERLPVPTFTYHADKHILHKRIFMPYGSNTTVIEYENGGSSSYRFELRPLLVYRDYHSLFKENPDALFRAERIGEHSLAITSFNNTPAVYITFRDGSFEEGRCWYKNFEYAKERYRGLDFQEDSFSIGSVHYELFPGKKIHLLLTLDASMCHADPEVLLQKEIARVQNIHSSVLARGGKEHSASEQFLADLACAADQFIVQRKSSNGHTLIAGYPWFTDWGRDTMIAMRGLVIDRGQQDIAKSIIRTFLQYLNQGMLPNRFPDTGEALEYNTVDATLWLFVVLHEYAEAFNDWAFIEETFPKLREILQHHIKGTRYSIHMTEAGLLFGGEGASQLTWMDARIGDHVVTPRQGCAVEVNALWYNALMIFGRFSDQLGKENPFDGLTEKIKASFAQYFFNGRYLNDVIIPGEYIDASIRPNQVYAISLPYPLLNKSQSKAVLELIEEKLLTPLGLRSLDPEHPDYVATYGGDQWHRDTAYHQGTVWSYLLGEYLIAYLRLNNFSAVARKQVERVLTPIMEHFYHADCVHGISEIFDGTNPSIGRGCVHQAWSIGMIMKVLLLLQKNRASSTKKAVVMQNA